MDSRDERVKPCCVVLEDFGNVTPKSTLSAELREAINRKNLLTTKTRSKVLLDLDEITNNEEEKNRKHRREQAIREITKSERAYIKQLELIEEYFMVPIKERQLLPVDKYQTLFGSIKTILNVNRELLSELRKNQENVAVAFSKLAPFFKIYSVYAYDFKNSLEILQKSKTNAPLINFLESQETRPEVQQKLSALLIAPIQRIPRYCLLIKQLLDYTPKSNGDFQLLQETLKRVEDAAKHVNSLVEEHENSQRLVELQRSFVNNYPTIVTPGRKLIKEGDVNYMEKHDRKKKYLILTTDIILICKGKKADISLINSLKCEHILPVNKCKITEELSRGGFTIICRDETFTFYHTQLATVQAWVKTLRETIKDAVSNRLTLRKESSSRRPANHKQLDLYQVAGVSPGQPRRKRKLEESGGKVEQNGTEHLAENHSKRMCLPAKTLSRRPIREAGSESTSKYQGGDARDILYPLREGLQLAKHPMHLDEVDYAQGSTNNQVTPYVFGRENERAGFHFSKIFTGIGSSFKKFLGFGKNDNS